MVLQKAMTGLLLAVQLALAAGAAVDLTGFETSYFPAWRESFRSGNQSAGQFSWLPAHKRNRTQGTSLYGSTDLVYAVHAVGLLDGLSLADRAQWSDVINGFQDPTTGWYLPYAWEAQNTANWPWHPTHAAVETLGLLGHAPRYAMTAAEAILRNSSGWERWMDKWIATSTNVWSGSQQAQSLPGIVRSADPARQWPFYEWFFDWLVNASDPATGYWVGKTTSVIGQLGGSFHLYHVFSCFGRAWPHPDKVVDATLAAQGKNGMWGHSSASYCIDLDGIYSLTRSAQLTRRQRDQQPYRWADVRAACALYLQTAASQLTDKSGLLEGQWAQNSHLMHGALYAVAECQLWFPELVHTIRPWRRAGGGHVDNRSCAYA